MRKYEYDDDVETAAIDFLENNLEAVKEGLTDERDSLDNIRGHGLRDSFHGEVVDKGYTPEDAIAVLEGSDNEETDSGLWEGLDWREALSARAAYTFGNDVWCKAEEIYDDLSERVTTMCELTADREPDAEPERSDEVEKVLKDWEDERRIQPITDPKEELEALEKWTRLNEASGWWSGYPVGGSYIDARCGTGQGMPGVKAFVEYDHEIALLVPALAGKYKEVVAARIAELKEPEAPEALMYVVADMYDGLVSALTICDTESDAQDRLMCLEKKCGYEGSRAYVILSDKTTRPV